VIAADVVSTLILLREVKAMTKIIGACLLICVSVLTFSRPAMAQQKDGKDEVQLKTRLVVVDALVKEKRTGAPVADLLRTDFEVLDEGKRRTVTHFSVGEKRQPLALVLLFDLAHNGAGRFFHHLDIPKSLNAALSRLSPQDEVAIIAMTGKGINTMQRELTGFTSDRKRIMEALAKIPEVTTPDSFGVFFIADILSDVAGEARLQRPNSDVVILYVTDNLNPVSPAERRHGAESLLRKNVTFNALLTKTLKSVTARSVPVRPLFLALGISWNGAEHFAKQTGGEVIKVDTPENYRAGLEKLMGDLASRYTLGFELDAAEPNDGRLHKLEVRVKARDKSGKERKLEVVTRRAYYLPKSQAATIEKAAEKEVPPDLAEQKKAQADEQAIKQAVYDLHYAVMTGDVDGIKRRTAKRTLDLCRTVFDLLFKQLSNGEGDPTSMPVSNGDELFSFVLRLTAQASGGKPSLEQIKEKARAKPECRVTLTGNQMADIKYSDGTSAKAVLEEGVWKIDDTERLKEAMLNTEGLTPEQKERIKKH
jgi:VWFA-related protein